MRTPIGTLTGKLRDDCVLCDVVLAVRGRRFPAHRALLCGVSRWLRALLLADGAAAVDGGLAEAKRRARGGGGGGGGAVGADGGGADDDSLGDDAAAAAELVTIDTEEIDVDAFAAVRDDDVESGPHGSSLLVVAKRPFLAQYARS